MSGNPFAGHVRAKHALSCSLKSYVGATQLLLYAAHTSNSNHVYTEMSGNIVGEARQPSRVQVSTERLCSKTGQYGGYLARRGIRAGHS